MSINATLVDYGCGNILSISQAIHACGAKVSLTSDPKHILKADRLILPGVGAFGHCVNRLRENGIFEVLQAFIRTGKPVLGICVGMQMLLSKSLEHGEYEGLKHIPGLVQKIAQSVDNPKKKVPFVGWAKIDASIKNCSLLETRYFANQWFYFVHSYAAMPLNREYVLGAYQYYEEEVTALVAKENVIGCQFHPEKSGSAGLAFLSNFLKM